jgi:hypothetical protein
MCVDRLVNDESAKSVPVFAVFLWDLDCVLGVAMVVSSSLPIDGFYLNAICADRARYFGERFLRDAFALKGEDDGQEVGLVGEKLCHGLFEPGYLSHSRVLSLVLTMIDAAPK